MILVFDCETNGLPKNYQAPLEDFDNWPRVVQLAWAVFDNCGEILESHSHIIHPDGWTIPAEATAKHGITQEMAQVQGVPILDALNAFNDVLSDPLVYCVVAHNIEFDTNVIGSEFVRAWSDNPFQNQKNRVCTMRESTEYCHLGEGRNGQYKWPKLGELYGILFPGETIQHEHDALSDALACARCFFELCNRGVIVVEKDTELFTIPDGPAITKLAHARRALEGLKNTKQAMLDTVLKDVVYLACEKQVKEMQKLVDTYEEIVRNEGLKQYGQDQNKKPGNGHEIKLFDVVELVEGADIKTWCLTNFTPALVVDRKVFDTAVIARTIPDTLAKAVKMPKVYIDKDLTPFLPVVKPDDESEIPF